ncbi:MAG: hypothetical protein V4636_13050 [Pseudomonadota bacterium]
MITVLPGDSVTLRDYFAGQAMMAFITNIETREAITESAQCTNADSSAVLASWAYNAADAMLAERVKS